MADLSHSTSAAVENCANEPIHIPGGIQPHGFLFSIAADGTVLQASSNATQLNGEPAQNALGQPLAQFLGPNGLRESSPHSTPKISKASPFTSARLRFHPRATVHRRRHSR